MPGKKADPNAPAKDDAAANAKAETAAPKQATERVMARPAKLDGVKPKAKKKKSKPRKKKRAKK